MSAHILIASADALIVVEHTIKKKRKRKYMLFSPVLFFCCHVVTLSHTASNSLNKNRLQAWQQGDNKIKVRKRCHTVKHFVISTFSASVTTWQQNTTFYSRCWKKNIQIGSFIEKRVRFSFSNKGLRLKRPKKQLVLKETIIFARF